MEPERMIRKSDRKENWAEQVVETILIFTPAQQWDHSHHRRIQEEMGQDI